MTEGKNSETEKERIERLKETSPIHMWAKSKKIDLYKGFIGGYPVIFSLRLPFDELLILIGSGDLKINADKYGDVVFSNQELVDEVVNKHVALDRSKYEEASEINYMFDQVLQTYDVWQDSKKKLN